MSDDTTTIYPLDYVEAEPRRIMEGVQRRLDAGGSLAAVTAMGPLSALTREVLRLAGLYAVALDVVSKTAVDDLAELTRLHKALHDARGVVGALSVQLLIALTVMRRTGLPCDFAEDAQRAIAAGRSWTEAADGRPSP